MLHGSSWNGSKCLQSLLQVTKVLLPANKFGHHPSQEIEVYFYVWLQESCCRLTVRLAYIGRVGSNIKGSLHKFCVQKHHAIMQYCLLFYLGFICFSWPNRKKVGKCCSNKQSNNHALVQLLSGIKFKARIKSWKTILTRFVCFLYTIRSYILICLIFI